MSDDTSVLVLRLEGPIQSWGFDSQYSRRDTALFPTKSGVAGICCAAFGLKRGCAEEKSFLEEFNQIKMTSISLPRKCGEKTLQVRRLHDYHTVMNTRKADGKLKESHITHRFYLSDALFGVLLEGASSFLNRIAEALSDPVWGVWLGRKCCIPSAPLLAGITNTQEEAVKLLAGDKSLSSFAYQAEADIFSDGRDSLNDVPVSFDSIKRVFASRRVITSQKES